MRRSTLLTTALLLLGCQGDAILPATSRPVDASRAGLLPATSYRLVPLPVPGDASSANDVNEAGEVVGGFSLTGGNDEAFHFAGGQTTLLRQQGFGASAHAINAKGAIAGWEASKLGDRYPAMWGSVAAAPVLAPYPGAALDVNDLGDAVGTASFKGAEVGFTWNPQAGTFSRLPTPAGYIAARPQAVNNDRVIVGYLLDPSRVKHGVLWKPTASGWSVKVFPGFLLYGIDDGMGTVGATGFTAARGNPAFLMAYGPGTAYHASVTHLVAGNLLGSAFLGDYGGSVTILPSPGWAQAFSSNSCGLAVGEADVNGALRAVRWDPGC